jgi:hypothetical protein
MVIKKSRMSGWSDAWTPVQKEEAVRSWIAAHPFMVLYQLATPIIYSYPAQQISLSDGVNNVSSDIGSLTIGYELPIGQNVEGDIASPYREYSSSIIASYGDIRVQDRTGMQSIDIETTDLKGIPDGTGGWIARDTIEFRKISGVWHMILVQRIKRIVFTGTEAFQYNSVSELYTFPNAYVIGQFGAMSNRFGSTANLPSAGQRLGKVVANPIGHYFGFGYELSTSAQGLAIFKAQIAKWNTQGVPLYVEFILATPVEEDFDLIDPLSYYGYTNIMTIGDYLPDVTVTCKVPD